MSELEDLLSRYYYPLSEKMIAQSPASPRDSSKLLVYSRIDENFTTDTFRNIARYIPANALLVFNDTKVVPARIPAYLPSGGKIELLCTSFTGREITALCERFLENGTDITFAGPAKLFATVTSKLGSEYRLRLGDSVEIRKLMQKTGSTPLPPYLKRSPLTENERRKKYQAVFAKHDGSIAAPTASLHFTKRVLGSLARKGAETAYVTLHVNLGTFMPLTEESLRTNELHEERFDIPPASMRKIRDALATGRPIIAVGTTALRALESAFSGRTGTTRLFIREGYYFNIVSGLITNFHVPRSSLMMLVAALIGREKLLDLYAYAARKGFRFLSFGDAMLIV